jgi:undecaprenyl-diphosphatase
MSEDSTAELDVVERGRIGAGVWLLMPAIVGFIGLAIAAHVVRHGAAVDHAVLGWISEHRRVGLTTAAVAITNAGSPVAVAVLALLAGAILWWRRRSPLPGLVVIATVALAAGLSTLTKVLVGAQRPPRQLQLLIEVDPSFPSGHVTGTMALLGIVAVVVGNGRTRTVRIALVSGVVLATAVVALTRLYLGVHWPTDVAGGFLLGGAAVLVGSAALGAVAPRRPDAAGAAAESATPKVTRVG